MLMLHKEITNGYYLKNNFQRSFEKHKKLNRINLIQIYTIHRKVVWGYYNLLSVLGIQYQNTDRHVIPANKWFTTYKALDELEVKHHHHLFCTTKRLEKSG